MARLAVFLAVLLASVPALIWGMELKTFSTTKMLVFFGPFAAVLLLVLLKRRPAWILFASALALLPVLGLIMPPARLRLDAFHYLSVLLLILCFDVGRDERPARFFDTSLRPIWLPLLLLLPSVLFAFDLQRAAIEWGLFWGYYAALVVGIRYLSVSRNLALAHNLLASSLLIVSVSILIQKLGNVSFGWLYSERSVESTRGMLIARGSGLFQDPQKAGQFIAVLATYLAVIWQRRALPRGVWRTVVPIALIIAVPALFLTVSRLAIVTGIFFTFLGMFLLGRQALPLRVMARVLAVGVLAAAALLWGTTEIIEMLPVELQKRTLAMDESIAVRFGIWAQSFHIFMDNPVFGIGLGNYQAYFQLENPSYVAWNGGPGRATVPDQPESGYLKILYETGLFGALVIAALAVQVARAVHANMRNPNPDVSSRAWAIAAAMGAFLVTFATLFSTSDARIAFILLFFVALTWADGLQATQPATLANPWKVDLRVLRRGPGRAQS